MTKTTTNRIEIIKLLLEDGKCGNYVSWKYLLDLLAKYKKTGSVANTKKATHIPIGIISRSFRTNKKLLISIEVSVTNTGGIAASQVSPIQN